MIHATTWVTLRNTMLSELRLTPRAEVLWFPDGRYPGIQRGQSTGRGQVRGYSVMGGSRALLLLTGPGSCLNDENSLEIEVAAVSPYVLCHGAAPRTCFPKGCRWSCKGLPHVTEGLAWILNTKGKTKCLGWVRRQVLPPKQRQGKRM